MKADIIFELVEKITKGRDEFINDNFHFINTLKESDGSEDELKKSFRVYFKDGCHVDVSRKRHLNREFEVHRIDYTCCFSFLNELDDDYIDKFIKLLQDV